MSDLTGKIIDRYDILEKLGQGGMAVVYKARDTTLKRFVALKVIRIEEIPQSQRERLLKRFEREAVSQAQFRHLNITPIYDYGEYDGAPYLVMEYLPGKTLKKLLGEPISFQEAISWVLPIADALGYAHQRGVLHRDVKPGNILIAEDDAPVLADFGIAKLLQDEGEAITKTGMGVGTPEYMSPEQWRGKPVPQTDLYALGVVLYELITGRKPYICDTPASLAIMQVTEPLPPPSQFVPDLSAEVEEVILKALAVDLEDRYQDMQAFADALRACLTLEGAEKMEEKVSPKPEPVEQLQTEQPEAETFDTFDTPPENLPRMRRRAPRWIWGVVGGAIILGIFLITGLGEEGWLTAMNATSTPTATLAPTQTSTITQIPTITFTSTATIPPTETLTPTPSPTLPPPMVNEVDGAVMVYIPAGAFEMGSEDGDSDESPIHTVYLDAFWMYQMEVTVEQYYQCSLAGICEVPKLEEPRDLDYLGRLVDRAANHPVEVYNWQDAYTYCNWAGARLPTEAEWEKAARGGLDSALYPWGDEEPTCDQSVENGARLVGCLNTGSVDVGSFSPNGYGLYDMAGNVWEWVADWYSEDYYSNSPGENPTGPENGEYRIARGGSHYNPSSLLRVANRVRRLAFSYLTDNYFIGIRCVVSP